MCIVHNIISWYVTFSQKFRRCSLTLFTYFIIWELSLFWNIINLTKCRLFQNKCQLLTIPDKLNSSYVRIWISNEALPLYQIRQKGFILLLIKNICVYVNVWQCAIFLIAIENDISSIISIFLWENFSFQHFNCWNCIRYPSTCRTHKYNTFI